MLVRSSTTTSSPSSVLQNSTARIKNKSFQHGFQTSELCTSFRKYRPHHAVKNGNSVKTIHHSFCHDISKLDRSPSPISVPLHSDTFHPPPPFLSHSPPLLSLSLFLTRLLFMPSEKKGSFLQYQQCIWTLYSHIHILKPKRPPPSGLRE